MTRVKHGLRCGFVQPPVSKSHLHRLLIANFLANDFSRLADDAADSDDIRATKRCLRALAKNERVVELDCGESGSTLRFLAPIAFARGQTPQFKLSGRLAARPMLDFRDLKPGRHSLAGDVSSQFITGLLFALPLFATDSEIVLTSPLESRGYVDMTRAVLREAGIEIRETSTGFAIAGGQKFRAIENFAPECDWSSAAFWLAANELGNEIQFPPLAKNSCQPDSRVVDALRVFRETRGNFREIDISQFPDSFPILAIVAGRTPGETIFANTARLRLKESDRVAAMADVLAKFGVCADNREKIFWVAGRDENFRGNSFSSFDDHRIAMSIAIGATVANEDVEIDNVACAAKSYPNFFADFSQLRAQEGDA